MTEQNLITSEGKTYSWRREVRGPKGRFTITSQELPITSYRQIDLNRDTVGQEMTNSTQQETPGFLKTIFTKARVSVSGLAVVGGLVSGGNVFMSASENVSPGTESGNIQLVSNELNQNPTSIGFINVDSCTPETDFTSGKLDPTLKKEVNNIQENITIGCVFTGHEPCLYSAPSCPPNLESPHFHKKALDIDYVGSNSVRTGMSNVKDLVQKLAYTYPDLRIISPWTAAELRDCDKPALNATRVIYRKDHVGHIHLDDDMKAVPYIKADPKLNEKPVDCSKKVRSRTNPTPRKTAPSRPPNARPANPSQRTQYSVLH